MKIDPQEIYDTLRARLFERKREVEVNGFPRCASEDLRTLAIALLYDVKERGIAVEQLSDFALDPSALSGVEITKLIEEIDAIYDPEFSASWRGNRP